jgi:hypothetical protein
VGAVPADLSGFRAAPGVFALGYGLQVRGVYTGLIPAEVVDVETFGDRPNEQDVCGSLGGYVSPAEVIHPVAVVGDGTSPFPAARAKDADARQKPCLILGNHTYSIGDMALAANLKEKQNGACL